VLRRDLKIEKANTDPTEQSICISTCPH